MGAINSTMILWFVLGIAFVMIILDNLFLRKKVFKLYERLMFEREKKASYREYSLNKTENTYWKK